MKKLLILSIALSLSCYITSAQTQLWFNGAIKAHPADFTYPRRISGDFNNLPIFNLAIGADTRLKRSSWYINYALSYKYVESRLGFNPSGIAPGQGFIKPKETYYFVESINLIGLKAGFSPLFRINRKGSSISLPFGVQGYLPVLSKGFTQIGDSRLGMRTIYDGNDFKYAVFYGIYFRPTYQFKLTKNPRPKWSFGVYAEGDLLILNEGATNPKWTAGVGLEVRYAFGNEKRPRARGIKF